MNLARLKIPSIENDDWLSRFKAGDEAALHFIYRHTWSTLCYRGRMLVRDPFVVETMIQEALLKVWAFRERMESLYHIYRFMRMHVTWGCLGHYRRAATRFQRNIIYTEEIEYYKDDSDELQQAQGMDNEHMRMIEAVLPYLSPNRQTMMDLYFRQGLSYKKIARRFGSSSQKISQELQKSLEMIRKAIHTQKCSAQLPPKAPPVSEHAPEAIDPEAWQIFKLRYEMKQGFETIAGKLNRPKEYVQQRYIEAHRQVQSLKLPQKKNGYFQHRSSVCKHQNTIAYDSP